MNGDDLFARMGKEAMEELASGETGWKQAETNTLFMAAFYMLYNHMSTKLAKPLYWLAGAVGTGVIGWLLSLFLV